MTRFAPGDVAPMWREPAGQVCRRRIRLTAGRPEEDVPNVVAAGDSPLLDAHGRGERHA